MEIGPNNQKSKVISIDEWKAKRDGSKKENMNIEQNLHSISKNELIGLVQKKLELLKVILSCKKEEIKKQKAIQENWKRYDTKNAELDEDIRKEKLLIETLEGFINAGESLLEGDEDSAGLLKYFQTNFGDWKN